MEVDKLAYWYWISDVKGVGPTISQRLISYFGNPEKVFQASREELAGKDGIRSNIVDNIQNAKSNLNKYIEVSQRQVDLAKKFRGLILTGDDPPYAEIYNRYSDELALPPVIHTIGNIDLLHGRKAAIVGTRHPSEIGTKNAFNLAIEQAKTGYCIVSGMALGIDAAGHLGALETGGKTIAVLGCGADICYPPKNRELYEEIRQKGLIVSEFPFGTRLSGENLRKRNRTIVTLAEIITLVEGSLKSGAMIAARFAAQQNKPIFTFDYPESVDNSGGQWLVDKGLATTLNEIESKSYFCQEVHSSNRVIGIDRLFREIWPQKAKYVSKETSSRKQNLLDSNRPAICPNDKNRKKTLPKQVSLPLKEITVTRPEMSDLDIIVGDKVKHPVFGTGEVTKVVPKEKDYQITIKFSSKSIKTLSWKFANLTKED